MARSVEASFEIGPFRLDAGEGLYRGPERVPLSPKELDTLTALVERAGHVVTKQDLIERVWPDVIVTDASLTRCVYRLRRAFEDEGGERYIETVPRRGYRFVAPVRTELPRSVRGDARPIRIAVLPFEDRGGEAGDPVLLEGLAEELIERLTRLHGYGIAVVARDSVAHLRRAGRSLAEIGAELALDYAILGAARFGADSLRLRVELVRIADLAEVWTEALERPRSDTHTVQAELAAAIANRLPVRLPLAARDRIAGLLPGDPRVHELYVRARWHWNQRTGEHLPRALELFQELLALDPGFARAHVGVANGWLMLASWWQAWPAQVVPRVQDSLRLALALDPDLAVAHATLGLLKSRLAFDAGGARQALERALALDPGDPEVRLYHAECRLAWGDMERAVRECRSLADLDPYSKPVLQILAYSLFCSGRVEEAIAVTRRSIAIDPTFVLGHAYLATALAYLGDRDAASASMHRALDLVGGDVSLLDLHAYVCARGGRAHEARKALAEFAAAAERRYLGASGVAFAALELGDRDEALAALERAVELPCSWLAFALSDPRLAPLHVEPRFQAVLRRVRG